MSISVNFGKFRSIFCQKRSFDRNWNIKSLQLTKIDTFWTIFAFDKFQFRHCKSKLATIHVMKSNTNIRVKLNWNSGYLIKIVWRVFKFFFNKENKKLQILPINHLKAKLYKIRKKQLRTFTSGRVFYRLFYLVSLHYIYQLSRALLSVDQRIYISYRRDSTPQRLPNICPPNLSPRLLCQTVR